MRLIGAVSLIYVIATGFALSGSAPEEHAQAAVKQDEAKRREGQEIFRYDTFGDEQLWTDVLQMHEVIPSVDPATALAVGLKVDVDALPAPVIAALRAGQVDLTNPAVTVELIRLNAGGALAAFSVGSVFRNAYRGLLYLDALGAALFAVTAANKVLLLGLSGPVAVTMGVLTGIGGGLIRDVLAGRPTLLMSREIYATPILLGCIAFVILQKGAVFPYAAGVGFTIIFGLRALAIHRHLEMPAWLTHREQNAD